MADLSTYRPSNPPAPGGYDYPAKVLAFINAMGNRPDPFGASGLLQNLSLPPFTVGAGAATFTVKTRDNSNASADSPIAIAVRDATAANGYFSVALITAAHSLVVPSGATLGCVSGAKHWAHCYEILNAGVWEPAVSTKFFGPEGIISTTILDGASDSATVMYSATARANVPFRCVGRQYHSQAAAGTWASAPTIVELWPFDIGSAKRVLNKDVAGGAGDTALTAEEQACDILIFTGVLTGNRGIIVDNAARSWESVYNNTSGAFTLTQKTAAGSGIAVTQGKRAALACDGTNVVSSANDPAAVSITVVPWVPQNLTIVPSRGGNAETIALKTLAGTDPTATDPITFKFRNSTAGDGTYSAVTLSAASSLVLSSGSTLGATNNVPFRVWLVMFNDAGTLRLGAVKTVSGVNVMQLSPDQLLSSTAEGGAGAADSAQVIYTGTAVATKAIAILGYLEYTLAAVGTWNTAPSKVQIYGAGVPLPGQTVQSVYSATGAVATGTTTLPFDDTIPQSGEGDQYMSLACTPISAANVLEIEAQAHMANTTGDNYCSALFQDSTANALAALHQAGPSPSNGRLMRLMHRMLAGTTGSTTFKNRLGSSGGATTTFNGVTGGRIYGGVMNSFMRIQEIMA